MTSHISEEVHYFNGHYDESGELLPDCAICGRTDHKHPIHLKFDLEMELHDLQEQIALRLGYTYSERVGQDGWTKGVLFKTWKTPEGKYITLLPEWLKDFDAALKLRKYIVIENWTKFAVNLCNAFAKRTDMESGMITTLFLFEPVDIGKAFLETFPTNPNQDSPA